MIGYRRPLKAGIGALLSAMAMLLASAPAQAQAHLNNKSTGPVALLPSSAGLQREAPSPHQLHLPGTEYRSGQGWWALACRHGCELKPLTLSVTPLAHGQYDGDPVPGQLLSFAPAIPAEALLLFKPYRAPANAIALRPGPVTSWHPGLPSRLKRSTATAGTMEGELALPDGRLMRFVPTLLTPKPGADPSSAAVGLVLELWLDGGSQVLGRFQNQGIDGPYPVKPSEYVQWVGDLDGDGKPDLLVAFDGFGTERVLFLSSLAKPGEIVGEAGRFQYDPIDLAGC